MFKKGNPVAFLFRLAQSVCHSSHIILLSLHRLLLFLGFVIENKNVDFFIAAYFVESPSWTWDDVEFRVDTFS